MVIRANYTANGRFEAMQMMRMLVGFDAPASTTRFGGSWKIQDVSNERFLLCLDVDPALSDSVGQAGPPTKSTVSLRFIDAATLEREEDGALVYRIG
jgi:hypothetical protein